MQLIAYARISDSSDPVISVAQEQLWVGKRNISLGGVRVRSCVVEPPVEEQVTLREDRVNVERRPIDRAQGPGRLNYGGGRSAGSSRL
jgi:stress response protein YsnF